jgi:hypothetical protein
MSRPRRGRPQARGVPRTQVSKAVDIWRRTPPLPEPRPIVPVDDPTALLRSLGDPPLPGNGLAASRYLAAVVERAAALASGLAATAHLLAEPDDISTGVDDDLAS